jgi:hypothetical protein
MCAGIRYVWCQSRVGGRRTFLFSAIVTNCRIITELFNYPAELNDRVPYEQDFTRKNFRLKFPARTNRIAPYEGKNRELISGERVFG